MNSHFYLLLLLVAQGIYIPAHAMRRSLQKTHYFIASQKFSHVRLNHTYHSLLYNAANDPEGDALYVKKIGELKSHDINKSEEGKTPLQLASALALPNMIQMLFLLGADPLINLGKQKLTPMHYLGADNPTASEEDIADCVDHLQQGGNSIDAPDCWGQTPPFTVSDNAVSVLMKKGANPDAQSRKGIAIWEHDDKVEYVMTDNITFPEKGPYFYWKANAIAAGIKLGGMAGVGGGVLLLLANSCWCIPLGCAGILMWHKGDRGLNTIDRSYPYYPAKTIAYSALLAALEQGNTKRLRIFLNHHYGPKNPLAHWPIVLEACKDKHSPEIRAELLQIYQENSKKFGLPFKKNI